MRQSHTSESEKPAGPRGGRSQVSQRRLLTEVGVRGSGPFRRTPQPTRIKRGPERGSTVLRFRHVSDDAAHGSFAIGAERSARTVRRQREERPPHAPTGRWPRTGRSQPDGRFRERRDECRPAVKRSCSERWEHGERHVILATPPSVVFRPWIQGRPRSSRCVRFAGALDVRNRSPRAATYRLGRTASLRRSLRCPGRCAVKGIRFPPERSCSGIAEASRSGPFFRERSGTPSRITCASCEVRQISRGSSRSAWTHDSR